MSSEVIEITDECPSLDKTLDKDYWIGKGRKYPKGDMPNALKYYVDSLLIIPLNGRHSDYTVQGQGQARVGPGPTLARP
jgi:hypothetical protein